MTASHPPEVCCYKGLVQAHQTDTSGALSADAAASIVADALAGYLAVNAGASPAAVAALLSMNLTKEGADARLGDVVICWVSSAQSPSAFRMFDVRLCGPLGTAWQAGFQLGAAVSSDRTAALTPATHEDAAWPPLRVMRPMRKRDCDQAGHVNVQVFMALADEAVRVFCSEALDEPSRLQTVRARLSFKRELFEGDVVAVHSGLQRIDAHGVHVVHGIVHQPSGLLACVVETCLGQLDGSASVAASTPAVSREAAREWPTLPLARSPASPRASGSPIETAVTTSMSVVDAWDVDATGRLSMRALINLCSTGARQYLATIGLNGARFLREQITVAAVDYLVEVQRRPTLGCNLTMRSAFLSGSTKSMRFTHHLLDSDDGTVYATVEIVGVMLDLATHRSMEIPLDVRRRLGLATD